MEVLRRCSEGICQFYLFIFLIEVWLTCNIILVSGIQHSGLIFKYIMNWSLQFIICYCAKLLWYYWLYPQCCKLHPHDLFYNLKFVSLNLLYIFLWTPNPAALKPIVCIYESVSFFCCCSFVFFFRFYM